MTGNKIVHDDEGQTTIMVIGAFLVVFLFATVILGITAVNLQARKLLSVADSASSIAAHEFQFDPEHGISSNVDSARATEAVATHLSNTAAAERFEDLRIHNVTVTGNNVVVQLSATARPPLSNWIIPAGITVHAESTSRTVLEK